MDNNFEDEIFGCGNADLLKFLLKQLSKLETDVDNTKKETENLPDTLKELQNDVKTLQETVKMLKNNLFYPCGDNVIYEINSSKLHISGNGSINDKAFKDSSEELFKSLNIDIGGKIGVSAFSGCNLRSVNINCSEIGDFAFIGNTLLNDLVLSKSVSKIGEGILTSCGYHVNGIHFVYEGTVAEWNAIDKNENWIGDLCKIKDNVIHCKDGDISIS